MPQPAEVVGSNGFTGLHFHADDLPGLVLDDSIDVVLVAVPTVVEAG
jgi:hypothetical protein